MIDEAWRKPSSLYFVNPRINRIFEGCHMKRVFGILFLMALVCVSCIKEKQTGADLAAGDRIPDFQVTMNDGTLVTGEQLSHGISCIVFFTTLCPDCRQILPHVQRIYDEYASEGVKFALISREDPLQSVSQYWMEQGYTMPYSAQGDRKVYELFARTRVPRVYICWEGIIRTIFTDNPVPSCEDLAFALEGARYEF